MYEVLADSLALLEDIQPGGVHAGSTREVVQLVMHPLGRGDDSFLRLIAFGDLFRYGLDALGYRGVLGWVEQFVEPIYHGLGVQVPQADVLRWRRGLLGPRARRRRPR